MLSTTNIEITRHETQHRQKRQLPNVRIELTAFRFLGVCLDYETNALPTELTGRALSPLSTKFEYIYYRTFAEITN